MTTKEYNAIIKTLREYIEDLEGETSYQIEHGITARNMVEGGFFACTNYQALEEMREWYGEDFDESRYYQGRQRLEISQRYTICMGNLYRKGSAGN